MSRDSVKMMLHKNYVKMCLPSLVTDTMKRFLRLECQKSYRGKTTGGDNHPLGVRGLIVLNFADHADTAMNIENSYLRQI